MPFNLSLYIFENHIFYFYFYFASISKYVIFLKHTQAHARVQLALLVNFAKIIVKKDFLGWDVHKPVIVMKRIV